MVAAAAGLSKTAVAAASAAAGDGALTTTSAAAMAGGGAATTSVVDCRTLGRNRRPPLERTMGCWSGKLRGSRRVQTRATTMRKVTKNNEK